jgi:hypothetical protein
MSGLERVDDVTVRRFEEDFEQTYGVKLLGPETRVETRRLADYGHLSRRLEEQERGLAAFFGMDVEELL